MGFLSGGGDIALSALFESKPDVPDFHWTDLVQQQLDTAAGNLEVLPQSEQIGSQVNDFMRGERSKTLAGIPGLSDIENQSVANLKSWLAGELPSDVQSAVERGSNAAAYAGGYQGSGMGRNLTSRDLGLTSLQLAQSAMPLARAYTGQEASMRAIPEYNPESTFINPMQAAQFNAQQSAQKWNRDWLANRIEAQPEPWQQTLMNDVNSFDSMLGSAGSSAAGSYAGGAAGGGGGGGMSY